MLTRWLLLIRAPQQANNFIEADAPLSQLPLPAHLVFLLLMFWLPGLFGRWLFTRFTLPLAEALGLPHPAESLGLLVYLVMSFEAALLLAAFRWIQGGRSWHQLIGATRLWPFDWRGMGWALPCFVGFIVLIAVWSALVQPRIVLFMQGLGFWKERNILLEINSMPPPEAMRAVLVLLLSQALGAFVEEVYMRGYLQSQMSFLGRFDWVLNGLLYGSYHLWIPALIPTAVVFGWSFALLFKWRKNVWPCIVMHFLFGQVNFLVYLSGMMKAP